ncbi:MAG: hypothetical protein R3B13_19720 [Polyangiaceae bacterium]
MKLARFWLVLGLALFAALVGCATEDTDLDSSTQSLRPVCGNDVCEAGESSFDCAEDCAGCAGGKCGSCGNGVVEAGENCDGEAFVKACTDFDYVGGGVSCNEDCTLDIIGCCNDTCDKKGALRCDGNSIQSCNEAKGCRLWQPITNCADEGQGCSEASGTPVCDGCVPGCPTQGATHCNGTEVETCEVGVSGCLDWIGTQDCMATGQSCDESSGSATCSGKCVNQCNVLGATQCSGNDQQTCKDNGSGCLFWSTTEKCAASGGSCDSKTNKCVVGCANQCAKEGLQTCIGSVVNTCKKDAKNCLMFSPGEDCTAKGSGYQCKLTGPQTASCEPNCTDPCTTIGAQRCQFNAIQTCSLLGTSCKQWQDSTTCPVGQTCDASGGTPACAAVPITGEDCGTAWEVKAGTTTVNWTASKADHLTVKPACNTSTLTGPDVVLRYNPSFNGSIDLSVDKPANTRWAFVVSDQSCGTLTPTLACSSEYALTSLDATVPVSANTPVYIYLRDTTTGSAQLENPLTIHVTELDCALFSPAATVVQPPNGSTTTTLSPNVEVAFDSPVNPAKGVVTLKGVTANLSFDLSLSPAGVQWSNANKTLTLATPALPAGEDVTVSWTGLEDATCKKAVAVPNWAFKVVTPPCSPGAGGMIGSTVTRFQTGAPAAFSEFYVAADGDPAGWVYVGGSNALYRTKKTGSAWDNVYAAAALSSSTVGYAMLIDADNIFTVGSLTSGNSKRIFQISSDKGASWSLVDYAQFEGYPFDDFQAAVSYKGEIFALTNESSTSQDTQIWRMPASGVAPVSAKLDRDVLGQYYCSGLGVDDTNFYVACGSTNRLVRVARGNGAVSLITDVFPLPTSAIGMAVHDQDADGKADFIYYTGSEGTVYFVCDPGGKAYADKLVSYNSGSSEYGLGFDAKAKQLYTFDSTTRELVVIH